MEWIRIDKSTPENFQDVYIRTDCPDCPILAAMYCKGKFLVPTIIECDKHLEADQKFGFIKACNQEEHDGYTDRITHWMPRATSF